MLKDWLYYKIYARPIENWYQNLLREIVLPFISENEKQIESFFFLKYHFRFEIDEGIENTCEQRIRANRGDLISFIRFRVLTEQENILDLEEKLLKLIEACQTVLEKEKCTYDEMADLGNRFGKERFELVRKYLEYACRISLSLLEEQRDANYFNKISGLIHLPSNILEHRVRFPCPHCGQEVDFQP
jgi:hypothetical protein